MSYFKFFESKKLLLEIRKMYYKQRFFTFFVYVWISLLLNVSKQITNYITKNQNDKNTKIVV